VACPDGGKQYALALYSSATREAAALSVSGNVALALAAHRRARKSRVEALLQDDQKRSEAGAGRFDAGTPTVSMCSTPAASLPMIDAAAALQSRAQQCAAQLACWWAARRRSGAHGFSSRNLRCRRQLPQTLHPSSHIGDPIPGAEAQLHAATAAVGIATANLYPQLSLTASASMQSTVLHSLLIRTARPPVSPVASHSRLFNHGALRAKERAAREAMHASLDNIEQIVLRSFGQVADALEALITTRSSSTANNRRRNLEREPGSHAQAYTAAHGRTADPRGAAAEPTGGLGLVRAQAQRLEDIIELQLALGWPHAFDLTVGVSLHMSRRMHLRVALAVCSAAALIAAAASCRLHHRRRRQQQPPEKDRRSRCESQA